ncbi:hypothetical protein ACAF76_009645 [Brevibacillus sp. TJ4]|uniref:hypothetical protein n=1 Tax=Brevibacillus sp. TJ4 TaxID=3234853 RepID=UPI003B9FEFD9
MTSKDRQTEKAPKEYLEVLGDTVVPSSLLLSVVISVTCTIGGFFLGQAIFPSLAEAKMVNSYSLLLGIGGSVLALIVCARLFKPSRQLKEEQTSAENLHAIMDDLQIDAKTEYELIVNDPVTRKEMEELGILETFKRSGEREGK